MFALHYAHEFYGGEDIGRGGGLKFPGEPRPDYWDFVYFSFVIGMTFQVSDVQVTGKRLRRLVVGAWHRLVLLQRRHSRSDGEYRLPAD